MSGMRQLSPGALPLASHVDERRLFAGYLRVGGVSQFGIANCCVMGILSVSRSVQCANGHAPELEDK